MAIHGEHGSGKTTAARMLLRLIHPRAGDLRSPPKEERALAILASRSWVVAFDNVSGVDADMSDAYCRLVTGGGLAYRKLYSDADEVLFDVRRPMLFTSITPISSRADLLDRMLIIELPEHPARRPEDEVWRAFDGDAPLILGALLDAAVEALRSMRSVTLPTMPPRMVDFTRLALAIEPKIGLTRPLIDVLRENRARGDNVTIEDDPIAGPLLALLTEDHEDDPGWTKGRWSGTASELLTALGDEPSADTKRPGWPKSPRILSAMLGRLAPTLRTMGITYQKHPGRRHGRVIDVVFADPEAASPASSSSDHDEPEDESGG